MSALKKRVAEQDSARRKSLAESRSYASDFVWRRPRGKFSCGGVGVMEEFMGLVLLFSVKLRKHYGKSERADGR